MIGNFDVLQRPRNEAVETNDEGLVQEGSR
jgi:hypothetical protein